MGRRFAILAILAIIGALVTAHAAAADSVAPAQTSRVRQLSLADKPWTGDFDRMLQRRMIRVLVPYSRTLYFSDKGRERGISADFAREFEEFINRKYKMGKRPLTVYIVPTTRDQLLQRVADGRGDIAVANLTITPERQEIVDFAEQGHSHTVDEIVVTGAKAPIVATVDALSGLVVHVRKSSSYYESLTALNERFGREGKAEIKLRLVPDALEDEDMMEMANAGLIDVLVVDDWKAKIWAQVLPKVAVHEDVVVHDDGHLGWAIRKDSPKLAAAIEEYFTKAARANASYEYRLAQVLRRIRQMKNPTQSADWKRFQDLQDIFRRYGERYGFDPLMLVAQGYQESRLDQSARSAAGAIGVMQLLPDTGADMRVGDIHVAEHNIHAAAKYMDSLMEDYFADAHFSEGNRPLFAFASYNAGPGNIARMRREAAKRKLDPDKWFNNVEIVVAEKIGAETTTYVRNIYKYYVAYKLTLEAQEAARQARESMTKEATVQ